MTDETEPSLATRLVGLGRNLEVPGGRAVNPPIVRMSTALFDSVAELRDFRARRDRERVITYGSRGTPTTHALEDLVTELEGGHRTRLFPTGLAAIVQVFLTWLRPGDHVLITDAVYQPVRTLAAGLLADFGIAVDWYAADGTDIEARIRPTTRLIYVEVPGSFAYEICDLPKIGTVARARGILVAADNTWGAGVLYRPLDLGADISLTAATKYLGGHSDVMMGSVTTTAEVWPRLTASCDAMGVTVGSDDAWLVLRGARTLTTRLAAHAAHALDVARWLEAHPAVRRVWSPALPSHPDHALWRRDFHGTNGLLSFALHRPDEAAVDAVIDALELFGIGASWGGYESLVMPADLSRARSVGAHPGPPPQFLIRLHIGLEDPADLIADLDRALAPLVDRPQSEADDR
ncbi:cystathionine beta-lyase [Siculibacillus lacustris]|uniref:Cystathionine beta-lyase n=1 Tax=Siculibacillus lacustris TaxID=1549641 RepID=A0A4Q9VKQ5_9HYPH|nr:cystathionine beta-lyase [Siculibacillus lacustris]TBW35522.1 cystathionine beta-lyase [Siculibacillus lacustris]